MFTCYNWLFTVWPADELSSEICFFFLFPITRVYFNTLHKCFSETLCQITMFSFFSETLCQITMFSFTWKKNSKTIPKILALEGLPYP